MNNHDMAAQKALAFGEYLNSKEYLESDINPADAVSVFYAAWQAALAAQAPKLEPRVTREMLQSQIDALLELCESHSRSEKLRERLELAAQAPVVRQEPVAWVVFAEHEGKMIPQYPVCFKHSDAEYHAKMYGQTPTEIRALFDTAPPPQGDAEDDSFSVEADAARYRWLNNQGCTFYTDDGKKHHVCEYAMNDAIDAAKKAKP